MHDLLPVAGGRLEIEPVDIGEPGQILGLHDRLAGRTFDLLFVDAGVTNGPDETVADVTDAEFTRLMVINALSPMRVIERLREFVAADGTIAIMSSGQGSIANNEGGGFEIFRASKSALNQLMRSYAARRRDDTRTLLLTAPGWIRNTGVGGPAAPLTIEESIPRLVTVIGEQRGRTSSTVAAARSPGELSRAASSPHLGSGHRARTVSSVSVSAAVLSSRYRTTRANRSATPAG